MSFTRISVCGLALIAMAVACSSKDEPITVETIDAGQGSTDAGGDAAVDSGIQADGSSLLAEGPIDRVGRSLTKWLLIPESKRIAFNEAEPNDPAAVASFASDVQAGLAAVDSWDGTKDWESLPDGGAFTHPLGVTMLLDVVLVDTSRPFTSAGYLDIEREIAGMGAHTTSGGRWLDEDDVDATLSLLGKKAKSGVSDGVSSATKPASTTFPYLASPN